MAVIETKYSIGDTVFNAGTTMEKKQHPCPDCEGSRKWKAISPAGEEYEFACPRCSTSYRSKDELSLDYTAHVPSVRMLTIGSVRYNSADHGAEYMCVETGVGSGSIYRECRLFDNEADALAAAEIEAAHSNVTVEWVAQRYNRALEISDYQLSSAALKEAADFKSRASMLLYNISDLFAAIEEAGDKDAVTEAVDEYRRWYWERDLKEVRDASVDTLPEGQDGEAGLVRSKGSAVGSEADETPK